MWYLKGNPFFKKTTTSYEDFKQQPFLLLEAQRMLKIGLELNINDSDEMYEIYLGERGIGKTTTLLFAKEVVTNIRNDVPSLYYHGTFKDKWGTSVENKPLRSWVNKKKGYLFIDVPDVLKRQDYFEFLNFVETLILKTRGITIIMTMNKSHYDRSFDMGEVYGKFSTTQIKRFNLQETRKLIETRLEWKREENYSGDPLYPFSIESVKFIHKTSLGIPRNILSACDLLFKKAIERNLETIDSDFAKEILASEMFVKKVIEERVEDWVLREDLLNMHKLLIENGGTFTDTGSFFRVCYEKFGWSKPTFMKRLKMLEKFGIVVRRRTRGSISKQIILSSDAEW